LIRSYPISVELR